MTKLILKTALVTLGVTIIMAVAAFGITSFCAPAAMMRLTASLGMDSISGDYAYQEYERSGDIGCLARAFVISASKGDTRAANERFTLLYGEEGSARREEFSAFCEEYETATVEGVPAFDYREFICGQAARMKYRACRTQEEKEEVYAFALSETGAAFDSGNPAAMLAKEAIEAKDGAYVRWLFTQLGNEESFDRESGTYRDIMKFLENTLEGDHE